MSIVFNLSKRTALRLRDRSNHVALQLRINYSDQSNNTSRLTSQNNDEFDVEEYLAKPTWSVSSLLSSTSGTNVSDTTSLPVTPAKLRHLLRLSALPEPDSPEDEARMLSDLASQLHFVRQMQEVDVTGVEPLQAIRDETQAGEREAEITIEKVKETLDKEEVIGKYYKRLRRRQNGKVEDLVTPKDWRPLEHAGRTVGPYFVVDRSEKDG